MPRDMFAEPSVDFFVERDGEGDWGLGNETYYPSIKIDRASKGAGTAAIGTSGSIVVEQAVPIDTSPTADQ
jgi:hypothetical protein